jgi:ribosome biogenesis GTPase
MSGERLSEGLLIRIKGPDHYVYDSGEEIRCRVRGRFRMGRGGTEVLPVVGDVVEYRKEAPKDSGPPAGLITAVRPRRSVFARAETGGRKGHRIIGANLDYVFLVHSVREPDLNTRLLDRMLTAAERDGIEPVIVINKIDLTGEEDHPASILAAYERMDYSIVYTCALTGSSRGSRRGYPR